MFLHRTEATSLYLARPTPHVQSLFAMVAMTVTISTTVQALLMLQG